MEEAAGLLIMAVEYWYLAVFAFGAVCAWAVIKGLE